MFHFITQLHQDLRTARLNRRGATEPRDATVTHLQRLPSHPTQQFASRFGSLRLPRPPITTSLSEIVAARRSFEGGRSDGEWTMDLLGTLFSLSACPENNSTHRGYPSGGARYPIETFIVFNQGLEYSQPHLFHYDPHKHALIPLWFLPPQVAITDLFTPNLQQAFSAVVIFTARWEVSASKYGDFAYTLGTLEAGHAAQNVLLAATAAGLLARPMACFNDSIIEELLELDTLTEQPVYTIILSLPPTTIIKA